MAVRRKIRTKGYEVTEDGKVFSLGHNWRGLGRRELVQELNADQYPSVRLTVDGKRVRYPVYKLVALHHLPPRPSRKHLIRHKDGDRMNSRKDNLMWGTVSENALDREYHRKYGRKPIDPSVDPVSRRQAEACRERFWTGVQPMSIVRGIMAGKSDVGGYWPDLVLVRGLPGSGKSTMAKKFEEEGYVHLEADQYFYEYGDGKFVHSMLPRAHEWCLKETKKLLRRGLKVVVSNTFSRKWEIQPYLNLTDSHLVLTARGEFQSVHGVPPEAIDRMKRRWEEF